MASPATQSFLETETVDSLVSERKLLALRENREPCPLTILRSTSTVQQALQTLARHRILSAPVAIAADASKSDAAKDAATWPSHAPLQAGDTLGFVDVHDILCSFLNEVDELGLGDMNLLHKMRLLEDEGSKFGHTELGALHTMGTDGHFMHFGRAKSSLLDFIRHGLLAEPVPRAGGELTGPPDHHVVHRVAFYDKDRCIRTVVSQMDIIRFLASHIDQLGPDAQRTVSEMGLPRTELVACTPETSAIVAMGIMQDAAVSSVAVVDPSGKLIGNFSISDLRGVQPDHFGALALPVAEFLALEHRVEFVGANRWHEPGAEGAAALAFARDTVARKKPHVPGEDVGQSLVLCAAHTTLGEVLGLLAQHGVHRLYCVDEEERPLGIITCSDILETLVKDVAAQDVPR